QKMLILTQSQAEEFYAEHKDRPFFASLVSYMTSAPVVLQVLEGDGAIVKNRKIMGATNPSEAEPNTIRRDFAKNIEENSVHGSDSSESAKREIEFFFKKEEIFG
ncbi:nucleoside-diphosphate kinase, partial [Rickettsiaceae bacterium]|nr:nucleoside-diphosphate kinase [Rickettsiaceae bacterium]